MRDLKTRERLSKITAIIAKAVERKIAGKSTQGGVSQKEKSDGVPKQQ